MKSGELPLKGLAKQMVGLLAIGSTLGFLATMAFQTLAPGITVTTTIIAGTFPTLTSNKNTEHDETSCIGHMRSSFAEELKEYYADTGV
jgi:hypothetical protein